MHTLFHPKQFTLDDFGDNRLHAKMTRTGAFEDLLDFRPIAKANWRPRRINEQLAREIARDLLFVIEEQALQIVDIVELASIGQCAAGIDRLSEVELERLAVFAIALLM